MDEDWQEHKLYLYGQLAFLPAELEHKALIKEKLRHYLPPESANDPEATLREYERKGYFRLSIIANTGEPVRYMLTDIDSTLFRKELVDYLKKFKHKLPTEQRELLWSVAAKQYKQRGYSPRIKWTDIYGISVRYNYSPPFWELIFMPVVTDQVKLTKMDYDKTVPYLMTGDKMEPMPKQMLQFYERPYAEFEILDKVLQQKVAKPLSNAKHTATLRLDAKNLWIIIGKKRYFIWHYQGSKSNGYRAITELYDRKDALTKSELNLKPNSKTALKDLPNNMGFKGVLRELFIELGYDEERHQSTLLLKKSVPMDDEQHERLIEYVKRLTTKPE